MESGSWVKTPPALARFFLPLWTSGVIASEVWLGEDASHNGKLAQGWNMVSHVKEDALQYAPKFVN